MYYINENEDVLVSLDKNVPDGFIEIPHFDTFAKAQINFNNLYIYALCCENAYKEFKESTKAMTYEKWLIVHNYKYCSEYYLTLRFDVGYYYDYDILSLSCLWGGNNYNSEILKPFIISSEYIKENYRSYSINRINKYQDKLVKDGFIKL